MTFNSYAFLLLFLPIVVGVYYTLARLFQSDHPSIAWLVAASLVFYASLGPGYLLVLAVSVVMNFVLARWMMRTPPNTRLRRLLLPAGIIANLLLLGYYKYTGFLAENINAWFGTDFSALASAYPVGLSFYTFIQIGFLIDAYVGQVEKLSFLRYAMFGTLFPYITAGPIVRQDEIFRQLDTPVRRRTGMTYIVVGMTMFAMGLFKKAVLADSIAPYVGTLFSAGPGAAISAAAAWVGALAYTFELYFDFSGYSDMALGLGFMLGLRLPLNFNSPLRATSLMDFWRRWHMTMVRFFTNYVYTPMAATMMRRSIRHSFPEPVRLLAVLCLPVFITFLLVGFWHGAGWGFIVSGAIHGVGLSVNLTWRELRPRFRLPDIPGPLGWLLMMLVLVSSLVFLRAENLRAGMAILAAMVGMGRDGAPGLAQFYGTRELFGLVTVIPAVGWLLVLAAIALLVPRNTQQILGSYQVGLPSLPSPEPAPLPALTWRPNVRWAALAGAAIGLGLVFVGGPSPFLYYLY